MEFSDLQSRQEVEGGGRMREGNLEWQVEEGTVSLYELTVHRVVGSGHPPSGPLFSLALGKGMLGDNS